MEQTKFRIPAENMFGLSEKMEKLNRRAKRLKCPPIETRVLAVERIKERYCLGYVTLESAPDLAFAVRTKSVYDVEVIGGAPILPDWEFLGTLEHAKAGISAAAIGSYQKHLGKQAEWKKRDETVSKHFGEVGKRAVFTLTVVGVNHFESEWSESMALFRMRDQDGNQAVWFTSTRNELEVGSTYEVKATVKRHDDYKGKAQTALNRISVIKTIEPKTSPEGERTENGQK